MAFSSGLRLARTSTDWLSLLKRAELSERIPPRDRPSASDSGRLGKVADAAAAALPRQKDQRAACARAYLRARPPEPAKALSLFGPLLEPEERPELWAEAFIAYERNAAASEAAAAWEKPEYFALLARSSGEPRFYLAAAALSLASGDSSSARSWLRLAASGGASPPDDLLWGAGLYAELSRRDDAGSGPSRLRLLGDSAYLSGELELARGRWERALAASPKGSWKTYASLASLSGPEEAASYYGRMREAFPQGLGALSSYAAFLAREGKAGAGLSLLEAALASKASADELSRALRARLAIGARLWPEERFIAQSLTAVEERPEDGRLLSLVLESLLERKRYEDFLALERRAGGRPYPDDWYFRASALLLEGRLAEAKAFLEERGRGVSEPASSFALGAVYLLSKDWAGAASSYEAALAGARSPAERCAALKGSGRAAEGSGQASRARALYAAAALADPSDLEAGFLARSGGK